MYVLIWCNNISISLLHVLDSVDETRFMISSGYSIIDLKIYIIRKYLLVSQNQSRGITKNINKIVIDLISTFPTAIIFDSYKTALIFVKCIVIDISLTRQLYIRSHNVRLLTTTHQIKSNFSHILYYIVINILLVALFIYKICQKNVFCVITRIRKN